MDGTFGGYDFYERLGCAMGDGKQVGDRVALVLYIRGVYTEKPGTVVARAGDAAQVRFDTREVQWTDAQFLMSIAY